MSLNNASRRRFSNSGKRSKIIPWECEMWLNSAWSGLEESGLWGYDMVHTIHLRVWQSSGYEPSSHSI